MAATVQNRVKDHMGRRPVPSPPQYGASQAGNGERQDKGPVSHPILIEPIFLPGTSHPKKFYSNFKKELRSLRLFKLQLLCYLCHGGCTLNY